MAVLYMPAPVSGCEAVRKSIESLVRRDGPQYGAEDNRVAGQCQESKGMGFCFFSCVKFKNLHIICQNSAAFLSFL